MPHREFNDDKGGGPLGSLLIVEDEPLLAMEMSRSMEDRGWSIYGVASSVDQARGMLSDRSPPDAAILDVDLSGKDVSPLARSLRTAGVPFIFCTGYEDLRHLKDLAPHRAVRKPATAAQIFQGLRDVMHSNRLAPSPRPA